MDNFISEGFEKADHAFAISRMKKRTSYRLNEDMLSYLEENYPNTSNEQLAADTGVSVCTIRARATKHGWHKSREYISAKQREIAIRCNNGARINTKEAYAKREQTMRKIQEVERMRIRWGLEQKTKIHIRIEPRGKMLQRNRLVRLGYIIDEAKQIAYWTEETRRAKRLERIPRGTKKGTIKPFYEFRPLDKESI